MPTHLSVSYWYSSLANFPSSCLLRKASVYGLPRLDTRLFDFLLLRPVGKSRLYMKEGSSPTVLTSLSSPPSCGTTLDWLWPDSSLRRIAMENYSISNSPPLCTLWGRIRGTTTCSGYPLYLTQHLHSNNRAN